MVSGFMEARHLTGELSHHHAKYSSHSTVGAHSLLSKGIGIVLRSVPVLEQ